MYVMYDDLITGWQFLEKLDTLIKYEDDGVIPKGEGYLGLVDMRRIKGHVEHHFAEIESLSEKVGDLKYENESRSEDNSRMDDIIGEKEVEIEMCEGRIEKHGAVIKKQEALIKKQEARIKNFEKQTGVLERYAKKTTIAHYIPDCDKLIEKFDVLIKHDENGGIPKENNYLDVITIRRIKEEFEYLLTEIDESVPENEAHLDAIERLENQIGVLGREKKELERRNGILERRNGVLERETKDLKQNTKNGG